MLILKHGIQKPNLTLQVGKKYKTVKGLTVEIFEVKDNGATCNCHGYIHRITASGRIKREWNTWAIDGRNKFVWGWSNLDLVSEE